MTTQQDARHDYATDWRRLRALARQADHDHRPWDADEQRARAAIAHRASEAERDDLVPPNPRPCGVCRGQYVCDITAHQRRGQLA